jgi:hypothetical protein
MSDEATFRLDGTVDKQNCRSPDLTAPDFFLWGLRKKHGLLLQA